MKALTVLLLLFSMACAPFSYRQKLSICEMQFDGDAMMIDACRGRVRKDSGR